jgi:PAS domain S-box-containing protein
LFNRPYAGPKEGESMTDDQADETLLGALAAARAEVERLETELVARGVLSVSDRHDRYRTLFESSADAILIIDGDTFIDCNRATVDMLRYEDKQQLLETHPWELSPPVQPDGRDSHEKANEMMRLAFEKGSHRFEWEHRRADGEVFPVEVLLTPLPSSKRRRLHVVWRDITQRKQLELQLRQAQKMETMGRLAGGIAHDFNNLLMIINGNAERLIENVEEDREIVEFARQIGWAGQRAAELTSQLLVSSRKQVLQPAILDLNRVTTDAHGFLRRLIGEDIELVTLPAEDGVNFKADPGLIDQVIINLAANARDAMPDGGRLTLAVNRVAIVEPTTEEGLQLPPGSYARLTVLDTGIGMDSATREQAFEPFFTTKPIGQGSGLGLSMVYGIVRQSGGHINLHSEPGEGTRVEAWFPTVEEEVTVETECTDLPLGGTEIILVVEDDESVSAIVADMLTEAGYTVLTSSNGVEALELYTERGAEIALILSDVVMPRMGGPELVRRLLERGDKPSVIFASGYTDNLLDSYDDFDFEAGFLQKPFSRPTLLSAIRRALDRPEEPGEPDQSTHS